MKRTSTLMFLLTPFCLFAQDGMPDTSFGNDGIVITDINNLDESVSGLAGDSNGRIILVGTTYDPNNGDSQKFQAAFWKIMMLALFKRTKELLCIIIFTILKAEFL